MSATLAHRIDARLAHSPCPLALQWPGGRAGPATSSVLLRLRHRGLLAPLAGGRIGDLADAYVRGELDIEGTMADVMAVAGALAANPLDAEQGRLHVGRRWWAVARSRWLHTRARDALQVRSHYDLSDEFFALWLDPRRVYSCAYYARDDMTLQQAQEAKLELVCRKLQLAPGQRFLDIGSGWGGLLIWAAKHHGVQATGITLSRNQHAYVSRLIDEAGLRAQVQVQLLDYRDLDAAGHGGPFDRIASVGMFEHVGQACMVPYFETLRRLLRPGGLLLNHAIAAGGLHNAELGAGMGRFVEKHIFPGGELMHVSRTVEGLSQAGLELLDAENLRPHYARTLWQWSQALEAKLAQARSVTSEAAVRAYRLYLAGSAMSFERGWLSLYQLLAARPDDRVETGLSWAAHSDYPFTRRHLLAAA
jgi:cyclopropane-fatty-acyl-phospholipid synthase